MGELEDARSWLPPLPRLWCLKIAELTMSRLLENGVVSSNLCVEFLCASLGQLFAENEKAKKILVCIFPRK